MVKFSDTLYRGVNNNRKSCPPICICNLFTHICICICSHLQLILSRFNLKDVGFIPFLPSLSLFSICANEQYKCKYSLSQHLLLLFTPRFIQNIFTCMDDSRQGDIIRRCRKKRKRSRLYF